MPQKHFAFVLYLLYTLVTRLLDRRYKYTKSMRYRTEHGFPVLAKDHQKPQEPSLTKLFAMLQHFRIRSDFELWRWGYKEVYGLIKWLHSVWIYFSYTRNIYAFIIYVYWRLYTYRLSRLFIYGLCKDYKNAYLESDDLESF